MVKYADDREVIPRSLSADVLKNEAANPGYRLMVEEFDVPLSKLSAFLKFMSLQYKPWMMENGAFLLAAGSQLTGAPGHIVQVWKVNDAPPNGAPPPNTPPFGLPEGIASVRALLDSLVDNLRVTVLAPSGIDPDREISYEKDIHEPATLPPGVAPGPAGTRVYLIDHATVRPGRTRSFIEGKREVLVPLLTPPVGRWRLLASGWSPDAGEHSVVHLWELPASNELLETMLRISENTDYQEFLGETMLREDQNLLRPLRSYDPIPQHGPSAVVYYR
jgi:hypothetical protein